MKNITRKINELSNENKKEFNNILNDILYSRSWCENNGIDYVNPNIIEAKEKLYNKMFSENIN